MIGTEPPVVAIHWGPRRVPLPACACLASGEAAPALGHLLRHWPDERLAAIVACAADGLLVVLGEEGRLPWVDGASYLGRDPLAPTLLLPTNRAPGVPIDLLEAALLAQLPTTGAPWGVLPREGGGLTVVSLAGAGPVARPQLERWLSPPC